MKRVLPVLLACLLLLGCSAQPDSETRLPDTTEPYTENVTMPEGSFYDPQSAIEVSTAGAVKAYPLSLSGIHGFACMGEDILVFACGERTTTLLQLTGETLYTAASAQVPMLLYPKDSTVLVTEKGVSYFDSEAMETVILDSSLKEINRIAAPEDLSGFPVLSPNRKTLYYATSDSIRAQDLSTGISKLLKQSSYPTQSITAVLMNGTVLEFNTYDKDGTFQTFYISAEDGQTLPDFDGMLLSLTAPYDRYYATVAAGASQALIWGDASQEPQTLTPKDPEAELWIMESRNAAVTAGYDPDTACATLDCYDLDTGLRISTLTLEENEYPVYIDDTASGKIFVMTVGESRDNTLYRWDPELLPSGDTEVYTGPYYTMENPDTEGLNQCQVKANALGEKYGIRILTGFHASKVQPWDYKLEPEFLVNVIERELLSLDAALSAYPADFLSTLASSDKGLTVCLVRQLAGTPESGSLDTAYGIQFWEGTDAYVAITPGSAAQQTLYHELFHVIESRVMSECSAYDDWNSLNPKDFAYDYDYTANLERDGSQYLQDETRAFIDSYSMSYPKEDRARIMEHAMMPGNETLFQSETMQAKLRQLCLGIREAFRLEDAPEAFLWEQYLATPLASNA